MNLIKDYEIRSEHGEDTLYIYLDFNLEFAKLGGKEKKAKLTDLVSEFLQERNIKFDGKKIAIISGGLLVATLLTKAPYMEPKDTQFFYEPQVVLVDDQSLEQPNTIEKEDVKEEIQIDEQKANKKPAETAVNKVSASPQVSVAKKPTVPLNTDKASLNEQKSNQKAVYVDVRRANGDLIKLELEEYVVGVVGAEMPASFNKEALKTQAVIARTYALRALEQGKVLTDNSSTQNYKSIGQLKAMWGSTFQTYYQKVKSAVTETKGVYLTYNDVIIDAVYHSTSNGQTEDAAYVWGNSFPYLVSVESPYDDSNRSFIKETFLTYEEIANKLGIDVDYTSEFKILDKTSGDRINTISINEREFKGTTIRNKLGLRSADFEIKKNAEGVTFVTRGYGHGVGLSQYGANGMANHGYGWESIIKHYYSGVKISHLA